MRQHLTIKNVIQSKYCAVRKTFFKIVEKLIMFTFPSWSKVVVFHSHYAHNQTSEVQTIDFMMAIYMVHGEIRFFSFALAEKFFFPFFSLYFLVWSRTEHWAPSTLKSMGSNLTSIENLNVNIDISILIPRIWTFCHKYSGFSLTFQMSSNVLFVSKSVKFPFVSQKCNHVNSMQKVHEYIIMDRCLMSLVQTIFVQMKYEIQKNIIKMKENFNFQKACWNLKVFYLRCNARNRLFCTEILK